MNLGRLSARSLFGRSALALVSFAILFQILFYAISARLIVWPLLRSSTDDLAGLMILSAQQFERTTPPARQQFAARLSEKYHLRIAEADDRLAGKKSLLPFIGLLQQSLSNRLGQRVEVRDHNGIFSTDIPFDGKHVRLSFSYDRIGTDPYLTLAALFIVTFLLSLALAMIVARKLAHPLRVLGNAAGEVGKGHAAQIQTHVGVEELDELVQNFNTMAREVEALLRNRTTLLAGISHDLRSPLARARVLVELAQETGDIGLMDDLDRSLLQMEKAIADCLDFSKGVRIGAQEIIDLSVLLPEMCAELSREGSAVHLGIAVGRVWANRLALTRVLRNLIENAQRYGGREPAQLGVLSEDQFLCIDVLDRGTGIPEAELERVFQPFVRLEGSRNAQTGGSGLGLAVVKDICRAHDWRISLRNREGGGLQARLCLPSAKTAL